MLKKIVAGFVRLQRVQGYGVRNKAIDVVLDFGIAYDDLINEHLFQE